MREIKFRAWNGEMTYINDWYWYEANGVHDVEAGLAYGGYALYNLMQFTGLKDKNGVEIYEGDILDFSGDKKGVLICEVVYSAPSFSRKWLNKRTSDIRNREIEPLAWNTDIVYEVIGNIHENQELLES